MGGALRPICRSLDVFVRFFSVKTDSFFIGREVSGTNLKVGWSPVTVAANGVDTSRQSKLETKRSHIDKCLNIIR